mgnify:CR=1 FL=1
MNQQIPETWTAREVTDRARHLATCRVCSDKLRPAEDQKLYAAKNARTREFVHVLVNGESLEDKLGWPRGEILYSIMLEDGAAKGPRMSEETKRKLRELDQLRRSLRRVPANAPARHAEGEEETAVAKKKKKIKRTKKVSRDAAKAVQAKAEEKEPAAA